MAASIGKVDRPRTKAQIARTIADASEVPLKDVTAVLDTLGDIVRQDLSPRGPGAVTLLGMVKVDIQAQTARPKRMGRNPATGEEIEIPARRAKKRGKVRVRALKPLKDVL